MPAMPLATEADIELDAGLRDTLRFSCSRLHRAANQLSYQSPVIFVSGQARLSSAISHTTCVHVCLGRR
jgi:hypothetical protein